MTRKYFEALSKALRAARPQYSMQTGESLIVWEYSCRAVAGVLTSLNRAFDRERFLTDCGARS